MRFVDAGVSGATLIRPQLERLRDRAALGLVDRLYVLSPDRLSRKYAHQALLMEELLACGVQVVFLNHAIGGLRLAHIPKLAPALTAGAADYREHPRWRESWCSSHLGTYPWLRRPVLFFCGTMLMNANDAAIHHQVFQVSLPGERGHQFQPDAFA